MAATQSDSGSKTVDILIVGAGIGGTALACLLLLYQLERRGGLAFRITILERSSSIQGHGQNIDIRGPGKDVLKKLSIDEEVSAATTGEKGAMIVDSAGKTWASLGMDKTGEVEGPTSEIEILRGRLAEILFQRCKALSKEVEIAGGIAVEFIFRDTLDNIQQQVDGSKVQVHLAKNKIWRSFDIAVGADGLQSRTRALAWKNEIASPEQKPQRYSGSEGQEANSKLSLRHRSESSSHKTDLEDLSITPSRPQRNADPYLRPLDVYTAFFSIPASLMSNSEKLSATPGYENARSNNNVDFNDGWRRWYHAPGRKSVMLRPSDDKSRLTVLMNVLNPENRDPRLYAAAIVKDDRRAAVATQKQLMREYFEHAEWECARLVDGMDAADDFYYDMVAQIKMERWSFGRVCLLGDAAHCASPFSGMGTTLALVGAYNLSRALLEHLQSQAASTEDISAAFSEYESRTRPIVTKAQKLPPGMPWLIHPETAWGLWVMHCILGFIWWTGLDKAVARLAGRNKGKSKENGLAA